MHPYFAPRKRAELYSAVVADYNIKAFFGAIRSLNGCVQVLGFQCLADVLAFFTNPHAKVPVPTALLGSDDFCFSTVDRVFIR